MKPSRILNFRHQAWLLLAPFKLHENRDTSMMAKYRITDHTPEGSKFTPRDDIKGLPSFGWRASLDYECQEKCDPFVKPRLSLIPSILGLSYR